MLLDIAPAREFRDTWVITADGEIDIETTPPLREHLQTALQLQPPWPVVLDLTGVSFLDSTALTVLVEAQRRATRGGRGFCVVASQRSVRRMLEVTNLDRVLTVYPDLDSALAERQPPPAALTPDPASA